MRDHLAGLDATHVSYSELNTLATCEARWYQNYVLRIQGPPTAAMKFGTVMHKLIEVWWAEPAGRLDGGVPWYAWVQDACLDEEVTLEDEGRYSMDDAAWLFERYAAVYGPWKDEGWHRPAGFVPDTSLELPLAVDGIAYHVRGSADDYLTDPDGLNVLVERKSMADWRRLDLVDVTPQETIYTWLARGSGIPVDRVLFDAIKTYRWALVKPSQKALIQAAELAALDDTRLPWVPPFGDNPPEWASIPQASKRRTAWAKAEVERHPGVENYPPEASFQAIPVYRDTAQIAGGLAWATEILRRRAQLHPELATFGPIGPRSEAKPIKNIGQQTCGSCAYQESCWTELEFPAVRYEVED